MDFELTKEQLDLQQRAKTFVEVEVMPHYRNWPITAAEYSPELATHLKQKMKDYKITGLMELAFDSFLTDKKARQCRADIGVARRIGAGAAACEGRAGRRKRQSFASLTVSRIS